MNAYMWSDKRSISLAHIVDRVIPNPFPLAPEEFSVVTVCSMGDGMGRRRSRERSRFGSEIPDTHKLCRLCELIDRHGIIGPVVYVMRRDDLVKVGCTSNLAQRAASLNAEPIAWRPGSFPLESKILRKLAPLAVRPSRSNGSFVEWFPKEHEQQIVRIAMSEVAA